MYSYGVTPIMGRLSRKCQDKRTQGASHIIVHKIHRNGNQSSQKQPCHNF